MYNKNITDVQELISDYFDGIFNGDIDKLERCFYQNAFIHGDVKNVDYLKSVKEYLEGVKNRQSPKQLNETQKMEIIGIDIVGQIAMAKLHVPMLGYNYYDYLSLAKINDDWKIVSKLFTHVE